MYTQADHTYVICAYKENAHIEDTIKSLLNQTVKSKIILSTSTPNEFLENMCKKYDIPMFVNPERKGAGADWNFGYMKADTELVTVAHQDDFYEPNYTEEILKYANLREDTLIIYSDYYEFRIEEKVTENKIMKIKRMINAPLTKKMFYGSKFMRRRCLSIGDAICCPAVTYVKKNVGDNPFDTKYINSCDYKTLVDIANMKGAFICIPKQLVAHRIYPESATSLNLSENIRQKEDFEIFCEFWPKGIAKMINRVYATSEKSNEI